MPSCIYHSNTSISSTGLEWLGLFLTPSWIWPLENRSSKVWISNVSLFHMVSFKFPTIVNFTLFAIKTYECSKESLHFIVLWDHYVWSIHIYAIRRCNAGALFCLHHSHSETSPSVVLWYQKRIYTVPLPVFHW